MERDHSPWARRAIRLIDVTRRFNKVMHYLASAALLGFLFLTVADIIGRSAFRRPVPGTVEVTSLALVVVVYLALAHSEDMGDHITIDLIYERVGRRAKFFLDIISDLLTVVIMALISFQLYHFGLRNLVSGAETPVRDWPFWPFVFLASFGAALYALSTVMRVVLRLFGAPVNAPDPTIDELVDIEIEI
jgi:TRAP-type C4-dicarboxylate transport system permease small subunit